MSINKPSQSDKACKIKCMVKKLKCVCQNCGNIDYIDLNLRIGATCKVQPSIMYCCTCSKCGTDNIQSNLITKHEQSILDTLSSKGYRAEIDTYTRDIKGSFDVATVNATKSTMPLGWVYEYDISRALYNITTYGDLQATATMYTELRKWIENNFPTNEYVDI
jgi:hypothetical protein